MSRFGGKIYKNSDIKKLAQAIERNYHGKYKHHIKVNFAGKSLKQKQHYAQAVKVIREDLKKFIVDNCKQLHWHIPTVEDLSTLDLSWSSDNMLKKDQIETITSWLSQRIKEFYPEEYLNNITTTETVWNSEV